MTLTSFFNAESKLLEICNDILKIKVGHTPKALFEMPTQSENNKEGNIYYTSYFHGLLPADLLTQHICNV